jgi:SNF2 family DNA or RNA helicase
MNGRSRRNSLKKTIPNCISRSKVALKIYQKKVVNFINDPINDSLLVVHQTGSGKTLSALVASQCYLDEHPNNTIIVISPASLVKNFEKEMVKYGSVLSDKYKFFSFDGFMKTLPKNYKNSMIIIDEAHNIRNMKMRYDHVYNCVKTCDKLLLLTATPFVNSLLDFKPIINLLYRDDDILRRKSKYISDTRPSYSINGNLIVVNGMFENYLEPSGDYKKVLSNISQLLEGKVSYVNERDSIYFPRVFIHKIEMYMSKNFYEKYIRAIEVDKQFGKSPEKFYTGYRQAVNSVGDVEYINQKLENIIDITKKGEKTLIFTNWIENGVNVLTDFLEKNNIKYGLITGSVKASIRMDIVEAYNDDLFQVLIITKAGSEGLDLKGTRHIIVMDPVWNYSILEQIIGRGSRYKSHYHLSPDDQNLNVYLLVLNSPKFSRVPSGDQLLYDILERKQMTNNDVENMLKKITI